MFAKSITRIALALVTLSFLATPAFAQDAASCADALDTGEVKSQPHIMIANAYDAEGEYLGNNRRIIWSEWSYSQYLSSEAWVEVSCDLDSNCTVKEDGVEQLDGAISAEAAELIIRLNHQIRSSEVRVPEALVNTAVRCDVLWDGSAAVLEGCVLDAWIAPAS